MFGFLEAAGERENIKHDDNLNLVFVVFSALRVYALWGRNYLLSSLVLILGCAPVVTDMVSQGNDRHEFL